MATETVPANMRLAGRFDVFARHANARSSSRRCAGSAISAALRSRCGSGMRVIASERRWLPAPERGQVDRLEHHDTARERMIDAYFEWYALQVGDAGVWQHS